MRKYFRSLFILAILIPAYCTALAQAPSLNFTRTQTYDVRHYIIRLSFDRKNETIFGDTTVQLSPLADGFSSFELDAVGMRFEKVILEPDGSELRFKTARDKILVSLSGARKAGDIISVRLKYSASSPKRGLHFVDEKRQNGEVQYPAQIWTDSEPDEARYWFPSFDSPNDKATSEQYITAEKTETVIGNGELVDNRQNPDGTLTWHYTMPLPHSTYVTSFVVGSYARVEEKYKNIPLHFYLFPGKEPMAAPIFGKTKDLIKIFEDATGVAYPFGKYDQIVVSDFKDGGMENITATIISDTEISFLIFKQPALDDLVAHELAHSWFGNLVTCRNWAELWLNEGLATYMEAVFREKVYGRDNYISKVRNDALEYMVQENSTRDRQGLYNRRAGDVDAVFQNPETTYNKGGAVIHTLRETIGDAAFWKGINIYLNRFKFGNVESADLQKVMEEASGQDLGWFFSQWVYGVGYPKLDVEQSYDTNTQELKVTIAQVQKGDSLIPQAFILPLNIEFRTGDDVRKEPVRITKRLETFIFKVEKMPSSIELDKEEKIPAKSLKIHPLILIQ
jgi:aminopeptidase N